MTPNPVGAIVYPFSRNILPVPDTARGFVIRASAAPELTAFKGYDLTCEQTFRQDYDDLLAHGFQVKRRIEGLFTLGLCLMTKDTTENLSNIARSWELIEPGG